MPQVSIIIRCYNEEEHIGRLLSGILQQGRKDFVWMFSKIRIVKDSGIKIGTSIPNPLNLLKRGVLVESPDVVYRFYPPNNAPKPYSPNSSLLPTIEDL